MRQRAKDFTKNAEYGITFFRIDQSDPINHFPFGNCVSYYVDRIFYQFH